MPHWSTTSTWSICKGSASADASKLIAAMGHFLLQFSRHGASHLPRAVRAAKGFQRLAPGRSRPPLPWVAVCSTMGAACSIGNYPLALFLLLTFAMYPRPGELLEAWPERIIAPQLAVGKWANRWCVLLAHSDFRDAMKDKRVQRSTTIRSEGTFQDIFF